MQPYLTCPRGHHVVHFRSEGCRCGGHDHYTCLLRVGSRRCGWTHQVPPPSPECSEPEDEDNT